MTMRAKSKPEEVPVSLSIRGRSSWVRWVRRLAEHLRTNPSGLIDRALVEIAQRNDFKAKPPKRA